MNSRSFFFWERVEDRVSWRDRVVRVWSFDWRRVWRSSRVLHWVDREIWGGEGGAKNGGDWEMWDGVQEYWRS